MLKGIQIKAMKEFAKGVACVLAALLAGSLVATGAFLSIEALWPATESTAVAHEGMEREFSAHLITPET